MNTILTDLPIFFDLSRGDVPKLEVQWSPVHKNKFITWGPDIRMYEVINTGNSESSKTSDTPKGIIINTNLINCLYCILMYIINNI